MERNLALSLSSDRVIRASEEGREHKLESTEREEGKLEERRGKERRDGKRDGRGNNKIMANKQGITVSLVKLLN